MRYPYHDLYSSQFEKLVVEICAELLGAGIQPFSSGKDGGRDARFVGTAHRFPSETAPWQGTFVIQAKHTEHPFAKFSDTDFSGPAKSALLSIEIPRIKRLVLDDELDHYMLFSNRRLTGITDESIRKRIHHESGAQTVELFGVERIDRLLKHYPSIADRVDFKEVDAPLRVTPDDLAEVISALVDQQAVFSKVREAPEIRRTSFSKKNELNRLSPEFAQSIILRHYLKDFEIIKQFLAKPSNYDLQERYAEAAREFDEQIVAHRDDFTSFDRALVYLQTLLFQRDGDLAANKRLTKLVIYYMYWNCDLGQDDATC